MNNQIQEIISNFFTDLLGETPQIDIENVENEVYVNLELPPELSGIMIGYRGEVLSSIQLILSLIIQDHFENWTPVRVNINNYREQRAEALENLAKNTASRVLQTNQAMSIPHLSSYERRLIHTILSEIEGVESFSEGEGNNRVLVVSPTI